MKKQTIANRASKIKLLLMDVDGVLTDGRMYFLPDGSTDEVKGFNALDGIGLRLLRNFGITTGMITGRSSGSTEERARTLAMRYVYMGFLSKLAPLEEILKETGIKAEETAYIGDDLTDIPVMRRVGLACSPANAVPEVKRCAHYIAKRSGGDGAAREICELILKSQGLWDKVLQMAETARWDKLPPGKTIVKKCEH
ncbi:MAG: HAD hydrolase family protein [Elusimicrobiales bacterium]